jgi:hypothetical protein
MAKGQAGSDVVPEGEVDVAGQRSGVGMGNMDQFVCEGRNIAEGARQLVEVLERYERLLVLADQVLRVSQPPTPGKIGIRWWLLRGGDVLRVPVVVRWFKVRGGRWRGVKVEQIRRDRLIKEGAAALNHETTYHLGLMANRLIRSYQDGVSQLYDLVDGLNKSYRDHRRVLTEAELLIRASHAQVTRRLVREGYTVDDRTMGLVDAALGEYRSE